MTSDPPPRLPSPARRAAVVLAALLAASVPAGCSWFGAAPASVASPAVRASGDPLCPAAGSRAPAPIAALIAYHGTVRHYAGIERLRAAALAEPREDAFARMCHAIVLSEPGAAADLPRAWALLYAVMAAEDEDALAVRPLARVLGEDVQERMRLGRVIERLDTRLRTSERARAALQEKLDALQEKLDALTEIERSLPPASPSPDSTLPPPEPAPRRDAP